MSGVGFWISYFGSMMTPSCRCIYNVYYKESFHIVKRGLLLKRSWYLHRNAVLAFNVDLWRCRFLKRLVYCVWSNYKLVADDFLLVINSVLVLKDIRPWNNERSDTNIYSLNRRTDLELKCGLKWGFGVVGMGGRSSVCMISTEGDICSKLTHEQQQGMLSKSIELFYVWFYSIV